MGEVTVLDTAMVDTVVRDPLMPKPMPKPGVPSVTDTVPDTVFLDTELDTDLDPDMEVMVDTPVDTVMVDTAVDMAVMVDTDTESKHFPPNSPKKPYYTKFCHLYHCRNERTHFTKKVSTFIDKDNLK